MRAALIGSTGFVGGNLARQALFDDAYHSRNIHEIAGRAYDILVCAGAPAEKWRANSEPERDRESIDRLMRALESVHATRVVLISTVDVYPEPTGVDESSDIATDDGHAYGRHRLLLERFVAARFPATVIRLPGLFGTGLKKNVIHDLLNDRPIAGLAGESLHQYYDVARLWGDVERVLTLGLSLVNLVTEPVAVSRIASEGLGIEYPDVGSAGWVVRYDVRTRYADALGGHGSYIEDAATVLRRLRAFAASGRDSQ